MSHEEYLARRRHAIYMRETGRPLMVKGEEHQRMLRKVRAFHARGMSFVQMSKATGIPPRTVANFAWRSRSGLRRSTYASLLAMRFEEPEPHVRVSALGTRRRLAALWVEGFPLPWLVDRLAWGNRGYYQALIRGSKGSGYVRYSTHVSVDALYEKLQGSDPLSMGIDLRTKKFVQTFASKKDLAPSHCWDPDTIDDPDAFPEWTGACGTAAGNRIHQRDGIPLCAPCKAAGSASMKFSGAKLKALREARGWSLYYVEKELGLGKGHAHHWEGGRYGPRPAVLSQLMSLFDVTFEDLYEEDV